MIKISETQASTSTLVAFSGFGYPHQGHWRVLVTGVAFHLPCEFSMRQRMMIRVLGGVMQATPDQLDCEMFRTRITPFLADADHKRSIIVDINGKPHRLRKKTRKNGHFSDWLTLSNEDVEAAATGTGSNRRIEFTVVNEGRPSETASGSIYLHRPGGVCVVSDIDDTIKESGVGDRRELLANTFLRDFRSVAGMSDVYQQWEDAGASFHYVSSTPWQLYESLQSMHTDHDFPLGTMHLRNFRLRDQLLKRVMVRRKGKATAIRSLLKNMPERDFVLVGDSGEKDPKIYTKICRQFPHRVKAVFIRDVPESPLEDDRFGKLKKALPDGICARFSDSKELSGLAQGIF